MLFAFSDWNAVVRNVSHVAPIPATFAVENFSGGIAKFACEPRCSGIGEGRLKPYYAPNTD
jgi:hypothetical protein